METVLFLDLYGRLFIRPVEGTPNSADWAALANAVQTWGDTRGLRVITQRAARDIRQRAQHIDRFMLVNHGDYVGWRSEYMGGVTHRSFVHLCER